MKRNTLGVTLLKCLIHEAFSPTLNSNAAQLEAANTTLITNLNGNAPSRALVAIAPSLAGRVAVLSHLINALTPAGHTYKYATYGVYRLE
jgi:hypothetical protein